LPTAEHPCPPWVELPSDPYSNVETAYLGCSVDLNVSNSLEDRRDQERGRALGPTNGNRESLAAGRYETGQAKPLPSTGSPTPTIVFGANGAMP
jgi:type IV pilus biogenesis protein CpaD/CtpE